MTCSARLRFLNGHDQLDAAREHLIDRDWAEIERVDGGLDAPSQSRLDFACTSWCEVFTRRLF
jgi:hypothetical protein